MIIRRRESNRLVGKKGLKFTPERIKVGSGQKQVTYRKAKKSYQGASNPGQPSQKPDDSSF